MNKLVVSVSPHIRKDISVSKIMWIVTAALLPAYAYTIYTFGVRTVWVTLAAIFGAVVAEAGMQYLMKRKITVSDGSAILTALLMVYNVPQGIALWKVALGSFFAIAVAKQLFGGLGYNIFNPALIGRAFLMASYPASMTSGWAPPHGNGALSLAKEAAQACLQPNAPIEAQKLVDAVSSATPLGALKAARVAADNPEIRETAHNIWDALMSPDMIKEAFMGNIGGCFGETTALFLLIGGLVLIFLKIVDWRVPAGYIGTVALLAWAFGGHDGLFSGMPLFHVVTGGLMLGAFFMATDMVTSPLTRKGKWIFAVFLGVLTFGIRTWGGYPEGVSYSILIMNMFVPLIDRYTIPKVFGTIKEAKA